MTNFDFTAAWAGNNKGDIGRLGVTGFCRGGRQTWLYAAHNPRLKAAAVWYGPIKGPTSDIQPHTVLHIVDQIKCPVLGQYGG
jgi:carboxymethylenebutenolidase